MDKQNVLNGQTEHGAHTAGQHGQEHTHETSAASSTLRSVALHAHAHAHMRVTVVGKNDCNVQTPPTVLDGERTARRALGAPTLAARQLAQFESAARTVA